MQIITLPRLAVDFLSRGRDIGLLLLRLSVGALFLVSGWGKVHDLAKVTAFFGDLGIPWPAFNAVLVSVTELVGGGLLLLGLASRFAALPLFFSMVVAVITARRDDIGGVADLFGIEEVTYALVLLAIALVGPGRIALDRFVARRFAD